MTVRNRGPNARTGVLVSRGPLDRQQLTRPLTVPGGEVADLIIELPPSWCDLQLCFESDEDRRCALVESTWADGRSLRGADVLVAQRRLELRPAFSVLDGEGSAEPTPGRDGPAQTKIAFASMNQSAGTPRLPLDPAGYAHLRLVVVEAPLLDRLSNEARAALFRWVRTGGDLAVVTSGADEVLASPALASLMPRLEGGSGPMTVLFSPGLNALYRASERSLSTGDGEASRLQLRGPGLVARPWGASRQVGLGRVHLLVTSPRAEPALSPDAGVAARAALQSLVEDARSTEAVTWSQVNLDLAARGRLQRAYSSDGVDEWGAARRLALDANQAHRLPLWVYLLIVLACTTGLYFVQRRWSWGGRGVARLVGPIAAVAVAGCLALFGLSWAARGPGNRYRSMAWIEAVSGEPVGALWRRLALAFDAPGPHRLSVEEGLRIAAPRSTLSASDDGASLAVSGGRWETVIAAEHGVVDLGGEVTLEWADGAPRAVRNGLDVAIEDAWVEHGAEVYFLGTVAPGARVELSEACRDGRGPDPTFVPEALHRQHWSGSRERALLLGEVDRGCPDRGDFRGDECHTSLVVWGSR